MDAWGNTDCGDSCMCTYIMTDLIKNVDSKINR